MVGWTRGGHTERDSGVGIRRSGAGGPNPEPRHPNSALLMHWSPLNVLLELLFGAGLLAAVGALVYALRRRNTRLVVKFAIAMDVWIAAYVATLLVVSLTSREIVLPVGVAKHFCGFYIDCHLSVALVNASTTPT